MTNSLGEGNYEAINRAVFERYLLDLARESAAEEERLHRELQGEELNIQVRDIQLVGEYPDTRLKIKTYDRRRNREFTSSDPIWDLPEYSEKKGDKPRNPERMIGDILMWARGG